MIPYTLFASYSSEMEEVLTYDPSMVFKVILAAVWLYLFIDKGKTLIQKKKDDSYIEKSKEQQMEHTVVTDHERVNDLRMQVEALCIGLREVLKTNLMEMHDNYLGRTPEPYITRYERLTWISSYSAYKGLKGNSIVDGFNEEVMRLPIKG